MRSLKTLLTVIGAVTVLVLASNTLALAATGHALILGKKNTANKITKLKRTTEGPALKLKTTSPSASPLVVNGKGKVANLNADKIDGKDSSAFAPSSLSGQVSSIADNTPIAVGFINANGSIASSRGVSASTWNAALSRYDITLTGVSYFYSNFATTVTPICPNVAVRTSSAGDNLLVQVHSAGAASQCGFAFSVVELP